MLQRLHQIGIVCALKKLKHTLFPSTEVKAICARDGAYEYLQRYAYVLEKENHQTWHPEKGRKVIWTCWLQGIENAPKVVQKCIESMHEYANGYEVIVLDQSTISDYIELPDYIKEKYRKGIIPHAQYSDLVRLALLQKYGGIWIDSTILLTGEIPNYITRADLFVFRTWMQGHSCIYNPFLVSCPNHPLLGSVLSLLYEYWKNEDKLVSYSIMHLMFTTAIYASPQNQELWEKVPIVDGIQMFYLLPQMNKPYNAEAYHLATQLSSMHKLTYKFAQFGIDTNKEETFYDVLINGKK
ncbi:MAG: capsular polysaccharide synthesis protein [Paludibacteraceae bacterium]|nr:capsular polysaccharide synthesis protein [Paludibacteraceae bacterium]